MTNAGTELNELEYDLLTELFNIGVGRAAASLSEMLNQEIKLSVPEITFCTVNTLIQRFNASDNIITITQDISGPFDMKSMLVFPSDGSIHVIRAMLGEHLTDEMATELQQEAFSEIGNIILNACIGIIAKTLDETFAIELPHFNQDKPAAVFNENTEDGEQVVMSMQVDLTLTTSAISGYIAFILGSVSLENIKIQLNKMLNNV